MALTTLAAIKAAFNLPTADKDAAITALIPQAQAVMERYCGRLFEAADVTEYPELSSPVVSWFRVSRPPVNSIASLYLSAGVPRVYDATTLLVEGTDFFVVNDSGAIELATPRCFSGPTAKSAKLTYNGGFAAVPADLAHACGVLVSTKLMKADHGGLYHFFSAATADGNVQGITKDDLTDDLKRTLDFYRLGVVA